MRIFFGRSKPKHAAPSRFAGARAGSLLALVAVVALAAMLATDAADLSSGTPSPEVSSPVAQVTGGEAATARVVGAERLRDDLRAAGPSDREDRRTADNGPAEEADPYLLDCERVEAAACDSASRDGSVLRLYLMGLPVRAAERIADERSAEATEARASPETASEGSGAEEARSEGDNAERSDSNGQTSSNPPPETEAAPSEDRSSSSEREPVASGRWPDASSTGWRGAGLSEGDLVAADPMVVTQDGAVIEGVDVVAPSGRGSAIEVRANDVTVRNCRLRGGGEASGPIVIMPGYRGLVVEFCELIGHGYETANLVKGSNMTLRRNHIYNGRNGPRLGGDVVLEENYIHGLVVKGGSHNDGVQSGGGCNVTVRGNHIFNEHDQTSALNLGGRWKDPCVTGYTVEANLLRGGGYSLYFGADAATGVVRNNVFTREHRWGAAHPSARARVWEGNRYDDGHAVPCPAC